MSTAGQPLDSILGALLNLQQRIAGTTTLEEFHYSLVNETVYLAPYRQAVLWRADPNGRVEALSGIPLPDQETPFVRWISAICNHLQTNTDPVSIQSKDLPPSLGEAWDEWLPRHALWLPIALSGEAGRPLGGLLLAREEPWSEGEKVLFSQLLLTSAPVWWGLRARRSFWRRLREGLPGRGRLLLVALVLLLSWLPVRQSVVAPAEVIPRDPVLVRAPLEGVVDEFHVTPNQVVSAGQALFSLDARKLSNRLAVTRTELEVARAEYRQAVQTALRNPRDATRQALLKGRMEQKGADLEFLRQQVERVRVTASRDGVAVFGDANDWLGRPVAIGEKILMLADPAKVELEIYLPVADALSFPKGAPIELFGAAEPGRRFRAVLRYSSYRAELLPDGILAYRLKADFPPGEPLPALGVRGAARILGEEVSLWYYLLRRPLAMARRVTGM
ncbi:MAG: HlyD family efflux transporter periplasmic adaptor subunit [Magnetococcales bacterium]|nr:HlyD family efflux transporter periplasmic adaptor subunit [Magnetococcales bacterium]